MPLTPLFRTRLQGTAMGVGGLLWGWRLGRPAGVFVAAIGILLALLAWLAPRIFSPVQGILDAVTRAFLKTFTWAVLAVVYFGVFVPLRVWRAVTRQDPLGQSPNRAGQSYLQPLSSAAKGHFSRQF